MHHSKGWRYELDLLLFKSKSHSLKSRDFEGQFYTNEFDKLDEKDKFLDRHRLTVWSRNFKKQNEPIISK